jgi:hypothetical protein
MQRVETHRNLIEATDALRHAEHVISGRIKCHVTRKSMPYGF